MNSTETQSQFLNPTSSSPLYKQVLLLLRKTLEDGTYPAGTQIPTEEKLCEIYGVSRITIRKAVKELTAEGLLNKKQGKGTFVCDTQTVKPLAVYGFSENCRISKLKPRTYVISKASRPADATEREKLQLTGENPRVVETARVRFADDVPVIFERNRFSMAYAYLLEADLEISIYRILRQYGVEPSHGTHELRIIAADSISAHHLNVEPGTPLLKVVSLIFDQKGRPMHLSEQIVRADIYDFRI